MRIVVCGDTHIGAVFGLGGPNGAGGNTRVDDYEKSLNYIIDYTIETGADAFIQTGDVFEHREPSVEHMAVVDKALKRLSNAGVSTFVIMGNHDYKRSGNLFSSSINSLSTADHPNIRILLNPELIEICNPKDERANLVLIPYRDRRMYPGKTNREQSDGFNKEVKDLIATIGNDNPSIAIGHNFFYEGSYNDFGGSEVLADPEAFDGCDAVLMGHLHQFRVLRKRAPVCVYTGSMEKTNFGDKSIDKYFIDYDTGAKKIKFCKIPTRELVDDSVDLSEFGFSSIDDEVSKAISNIDMKEKIVRLKFIVDEKVLPAIDKTSITSRVTALGAHFVSKINIETVVKRFVRNNSILDKKTDIDMLEAYVESQDLDVESKKELLKEAKLIMGVS